jgi:hypothetical protein
VGFTDADGNFMIQLSGTYGLKNCMGKSRVKCLFRINQRLEDKLTNDSCLPFMIEITNLFQSNINYISDNAIGFTVSANNKHYLTKLYFDKYPLMTSKHLNYLSYLQGLNYLGRHLTNEEIIEIQAIKNSMNNKRTYYN